MTSICIKLSNYHSTLPQLQWSGLCRNLLLEAESVGIVNFAGGSPSTDIMQSYCLLADFDPNTALMFKDKCRNLCAEYEHPAILWLEGDTELIGPA